MLLGRYLQNKLQNPVVCDKKMQFKNRKTSMDIQHVITLQEKSKNIHQDEIEYWEWKQQCKYLQKSN